MTNDRHVGRSISVVLDQWFLKELQRYIWSFELQIIGSDGWTYEDQTTLMNMVVEGKLKPVIHSVRPLSETPQALEELIDRKVFGKSVLTVND